MNSTDIKKALANSHTKDFFMTEVKTGSSWMSDVQIFDGFAMTKSWTKLKYTGYEIKISRSDFLQDNKWMGYLPYCNEFYWVCPKDLIKKDEISENTGLIYYYPDSGCLRRVKKAPYREIDHPVEVLIYMLMWRVEDGSKYPFFNKKQEYFKEWIKNKEFNYRLGKEVAQAISERVKKVEDIEAENNRLKGRLEDYEAIKQVCKDAGMGAWGYLAKDLEKRLQTTFPPGIVNDLEWIVKTSNNILQKIGKQEV